MSYGGCTKAQHDAIYAGLGNDADATDAICKGIAGGANTGFLLTSAFLVFMMQAGFALTSSGRIRARNAAQHLVRLLTGLCVAGFTWYLVGYAVALGPAMNHHDYFKPAKNNKILDPAKKPTFMQAEFIGQSLFAVKQMENREYLDSNGVPAYGNWVLTFTLAAVVVSVAVSAIAERASFIASTLLSAALAGFIFPVIARWHWSAEGWNSVYNTNDITTSGSRGPRIGKGAFDYAGAGVVHQTAGFAALAAATVLGPRLGRFSGRKVNPIPNQTPVYVAVGTLMVWFGWYGFNPGAYKQVVGFDTVQIVSRVALLTTISASVGGAGNLLLNFVFSKGELDLIALCNGIIGGLVTVSAGAPVFDPWVGAVCGGAAALTIQFFSIFLRLIHIDDATDAFAVHGGCGAVGVVICGFLARKTYLTQISSSFDTYYGAFYPRSTGKLLLANLVEIGVTAATSGGGTLILFIVLRILRLHRIKRATEAANSGVELEEEEVLAEGHPDSPIDANGDPKGNQVYPDQDQEPVEDWNNGR